MRTLASKAAILVAAGVIAGCAGLQRQPAESISWPMAKGYGVPKYVKEYTITPREAYLTRFVLVGNSVDDWTEALESMNTWRKNYPPTVEEAFNNLVEMRKKRCPEAVFNIINKDPMSMLYETRTLNCPGLSDENSMTRILYGTSDVFVLTYTNKAKELPKETRDEWIRVLSEARIVTGK